MMPSRAENVVPSAEELAEIAARASADAGGAPRHLLDGYLETLVDISQHPRPLRADEFKRWREIGAQAAEHGVSMRALIDLYLSATWIVWPILPGVRSLQHPDQISSFGESILRTSDAIVRTLTEGYEEVQRWVTRQEESRRRGFVDDLLTGRDIGALAERAERQGLNLAGTQAVATARSADAFVDGGPMAQQIEAELHRRFGPRNVLVSTKDGLLVCVAPGHLSDVPKEFAVQLGAVTDPDVRWRVGIGEPYAGPGGAVRSFEQARNALEIAERLDLPDRVLWARELLVYQVLARDSAALMELVTEVLSRLRESRIGAHVLLQTLHTYFMAGAVTTEAARRLHVGVRTVTYRLQRVKELTGYSVDNPAEAFTLQTAVLGARLIGWPDRDDVR
jgi:sugar diacid utilization regulator